MPLKKALIERALGQCFAAQHAAPQQWHGAVGRRDFLHRHHASHRGAHSKIGTNAISACT